MIQLAVRFWLRYRDVNWALVDQAMVSGVNFLTGILLARYLGLAEFGRFTLAWMAVLFVGSLQHALIISPMMSIGPKQCRERVPAYYAAVVVQQLVFAGLVFVLLLAAVRLSAVLFPQWRVPGLGLALAAAALFFQLQDFLRRYFFTRARGGTAFAIDALRYLGQLVLLLWLFRSFRHEMDGVAVLWAIAATAAVATLCGALVVERLEWTAAFRAIAGHHWRFSKWLAGSALMQWSSANLFILAAGGLLGAPEVGALKAAQNLMGVTHILFQGLQNIVPVRAALVLERAGPAGMMAYLRRVAIHGELATAAIAVSAALAPAFWLTHVYGPQFAPYGYLLRWYAVIYLVLFLELPLQAGIRAIEHTSSVFYANLCATAFSLILIYPLTMSFGLSGIAIGILSVHVTKVLFFYYSLKHHTAALHLYPMSKNYCAIPEVLISQYSATEECNYTAENHDVADKDNPE